MIDSVRDPTVFEHGLKNPRMTSPPTCIDTGLTDDCQHDFQVLIVGAGPVGLLIALRLGQAGVKTLVIEKYRELLPTTRAMVYQPVVLEILRGYGILNKIEKLAYLNTEGIFWRDINGKQLGHLPMVGSEHVLLLGQQRMNKLLLEEIQKYPAVQVRFNTSFAGSEQDLKGDHVRVMVHETSNVRDEDDTYEVDWLIAADGANSSVRRSLCVPFEGFSFIDVRMVGVDVYHDFAKHEYGTVMNFIVHPDDAAVVIYTGQQKDMKPPGEAPPLWRIAYLEPADLPGDQAAILERAQIRCARYARSDPDLEIARAEPYRLHQRCAAQGSKGRVVFVGDALHSNNPIGGLGLTTGICDAAAMGNALVRVCKEEAPPSLVEEAAADRRRTWLEATNTMSQGHLRRLRATGEEAEAERQAFFDGLEKDPQMLVNFRGALEKIAGRSFAADEVVKGQPRL